MQIAPPQKMETRVSRDADKYLKRNHTIDTLVQRDPLGHRPLCQRQLGHVHLRVAQEIVLGEGVLVEHLKMEELLACRG